MYIDIVAFLRDHGAARSLFVGIRILVTVFCFFRFVNRVVCSQVLHSKHAGLPLRSKS